MTSTGFYEGLIGVLFKLWHLNMIYFQMSLIWPKNVNLYHWFAGKSKLNAVSTSQSKSKQTWFPWCLMPICTIQYLNTQSTEFTNSSVLVTSVVYGEWKWLPQQNLLNSFFLYPVCLLVSLNAEESVFVVVVGCVQGSWSQVSTFSCLSLTQNDSKRNNFQEPVL